MYYKHLLNNTINLKIQIRNKLNLNKVYYWSPFLTPIATRKAVINSAYSLKKFSNNFECTILNFFGEFNENLKEIDKKGISIENYYNFSFSKYLPKYGKILSRISFMIFFLLGFFPLFNILKRKNPDYLVIHLISSLPLIILILFNLKTKFILRISGLPRLTFFRKLIWKIAFKKIYAVTCPTLSTFSYIKDLQIIEEKKLKILYDPIIEVREIHLKKKEKLNINKEFYLSIGRLTTQKNFFFLCQCFKKLLLKKPNLNLLIAGDGEEYQKLNEYIKQNKIENKIHLIGYKSNIFPYLRNAKGFIMTSLWEDPGFVLVEAAFCRTLVLTSDSPGPKELIEDNFNGVVFKSNDINSFENKFEILTNLSNKNYLRLNNLKGVKKFTVFNHYKEFIKLLSTI